MFLFEAVLPFMLILIGLVVLHELGHFVVAKMSGVRVEEFGIGFPPRIWGKRVGETVYSINWLPLGGFVRLTGEESARVTIAEVNPHSAAATAGLRTGDVIAAVNDEAIHTEDQLATQLRDGAPGGPIALLIQREEPVEAGTELVEYDFILAGLAPAPSPSVDAYASASDRPTADQPAAPAEATAESASDESAAATVGRVLGVQTAPDPRSLATKPRPVRILVMAAGAAVNAVLPIILFAIAALIPQSIPAGPALITSVIGGGPADEAGLLAGDRVISVDGDPVRHTGDLALAIQLNLGDDIEFVVERNIAQADFSQRVTTTTETFTTTVHARLAPPPLTHVVQPGEDVRDIAASLGVTATQVQNAVFGFGIELPSGLLLEFPGGETYRTQDDDTVARVAAEQRLRQQTVLAAAGLDVVHLEPGVLVDIRQGATGISIANGSGRTVKHSEGLFAAVGTGWDRTLDTLSLLRNRIRSWIAGGEGLRFTGPIGIAQSTGEIVKQAGWLRLIDLAALLSINLAIINILPLPMLDGGRIMFVLLEIIRRGKRISPEKEGLVHMTGFALLITMVIIISYFDIVRVVTGESALGG